MTRAATRVAQRESRDVWRVDRAALAVDAAINFLAGFIKPAAVNRAHSNGHGNSASFHDNNNADEFHQPFPPERYRMLPLA